MGLSGLGGGRSSVSTQRLRCAVRHQQGCFASRHDTPHVRLNRSSVLGLRTVAAIKANVWGLKRTAMASTSNGTRSGSYISSRQLGSLAMLSTHHIGSDYDARLRDKVRPYRWPIGQRKRSVGPVERLNQGRILQFIYRSDQACHPWFDALSVTLCLKRASGAALVSPSCASRSVAMTDQPS